MSMISGLGYRYRRKIGLTRENFLRLFLVIKSVARKIVANASAAKYQMRVESLQRKVRDKDVELDGLRQGLRKSRDKIHGLKQYHAASRVKIDSLKQYYVASQAKVEGLKRSHAESRNKAVAFKKIAIETRERFEKVRVFYRAARPYFPLYFQGLLAESAAKRSEELRADCYVALLPSSLPAAYELRRLNGGGRVFCDNVENVDVHKHSAAPRWSPITLSMVNHGAYGAMIEADGLLTVSDALAKTLHRFGRPIHVLKNFREFAVVEKNNELREMCGILSDATLLFASGNVVIGFEPVLRALALLPANFHLACFVRLVPDQYRQSIEELIVELGLQARVHMFSFVEYERLAHLAAGADVGLITSDVANPNGAVGLPNRCFDYITAGLPVIAPAMPDVMALISEYGFGVNVEETTAESWRRSILEVVGRLEHFRAQAEVARAALTWEAQEEALYQFLGEPKSVTLIAFRDLTKYQRYKRLARTLIKRGCHVRAAFVSMEPDLKNLVEGVEYFVTNERHEVTSGLRKLEAEEV